MQLFRPEALQGQDRLHGDVVLVPPVSWRLLGGFFAVALGVAALFLATAHYPEMVQVSGRLVGDRAAALVHSDAPGMVEQVLVREGDQVAAGAPIVRVSQRLLTAPDAGTVTAVFVGSGNDVGSGQPLLAIAPPATRLHAQLEVPAAAAEFLRPGQAVRLTVAGGRSSATVDARISPFSPSSRRGAVLVRAALGGLNVEAPDRPVPLHQGMTVSARIATRSRTLAQWLLDRPAGDGR